MATKEKESSKVEVPNSSLHLEMMAIEPMLLQQLEELEPQEQQVLCELLKRARRDKSVNGPMDELAVVVNGLKDYPTEDEWLLFQRINEKIAPNLHKEFVNAQEVQLESKTPSITKPISEVINRRSSVRDFKSSALSFEKLSALLSQSWGVRNTMSAYNRRDVTLRNFPTAGGLQCTEFYLVVNEVEDVIQGLYHYSSTKNRLELIERGNLRWRVVDCCPSHGWLAEASVVIFIAPDISRLTWKYGPRKSYRLAHIEAGVASQNLHLVATALELGSCMVFGFEDELTDSFIGLDGRREFTILLVAIGNKIDKESILQKAVDRGRSSRGVG